MPPIRGTGLGMHAAGVRAIHRPDPPGQPDHQGRQDQGQVGRAEIDTDVGSHVFFRIRTTPGRYDFAVGSRGLPVAGRSADSGDFLRVFWPLEA